MIYITQTRRSVTIRDGENRAVRYNGAYVRELNGVVFVSKTKHADIGTTTEILREFVNVPVCIVYKRTYGKKKNFKYFTIIGSQKKLVDVSTLTMSKETIQNHPTWDGKTVSGIPFINGLVYKSESMYGAKEELLVDPNR
jgi:hypothetical protein